MGFEKSAAPVLIALMAGGCALYPAPEDYGRADTRQIVRNVRCEARAAIEGAAKGLPTPAVAGQLPGARYDERIFDNAAIAYEFTLDMTEVNNLGGGLTLTDPFSNGVATYGLGARNDRSRQTSRNFRVLDTFKELRDAKMAGYCANRATERNFQLPMTGSIGLTEVITTFVGLNNDATLRHAEKLAPVFSDTLTFETVTSVGADPSVILSPLGGNVARRVRVTQANVELDLSRRDKHMVVVVLSLPDPAAAPAKTSRSAAPAIRTVVPMAVEPLTGPVPRSSAEQRALEELDRQSTIRALGTRLQPSLR